MPAGILRIERKNDYVKHIKSVDINNQGYHSSWLFLKTIKNGGNIVFNNDVKNKWIIETNPPTYIK